jgi:threonine synthase
MKTQFYSLKNKKHIVDFETALMGNVAPGGGLYFPTEFPTFTEDELKNLAGNSIQDVAYKVLSKWLGEDIPSEELERIVSKAQNFPIPIKKVSDINILELFHGPTAAFKDLGARYTSEIMHYFLKKSNKKAVVIVATSGDTGSAVSQSFANSPYVEVVLLFPKGRVSKLQEEQLTRAPDNTFSIEVNGSVDDCTALVNKVLADSRLNYLNTTSTNSSNVARIISQIIYYIYTYAQLGVNDVEFIIPAGELGNVAASLFANGMGLPFNSYIAATNANAAFSNYFQTGEYHPLETVQTFSNAMDIGNPDNSSRIFEFFNNDYEDFKKLFGVYSVTDEQTIETIKDVYSRHGYLLDPHTAVAWYVAEKFGNKNMTRVILSTASPVKFAPEITRATGIAIDDSEEIQKLMGIEKKKHSIDNDYAQLIDSINRHFKTKNY